MGNAPFSWQHRRIFIITRWLLITIELGIETLRGEIDCDANFEAIEHFLHRDIGRVGIACDDKGFGAFFLFDIG